uniref:DUF1279 domain-containing protein n=2 Tax=Anas TaxID=8835 RepID=A0A8B9VG61_9AVES
MPPAPPLSPPLPPTLSPAVAFLRFVCPPRTHWALPCSTCFCARARHPTGPCSPPAAAASAAAHPHPGPPPPEPLLALRAAAGSSAKDVGGSPEKAATDLSSENKKLNKSHELKKVFKECGAVGVSFHVGISSVSLGISYLAVSSGVDMTAVLCKLGFSESSLQTKRAAGTGTFLLAYAIHKLFAPV